MGLLREGDRTYEGPGAGPCPAMGRPARKPRGWSRVCEREGQGGRDCDGGGSCRAAWARAGLGFYREGSGGSGQSAMGRGQT